MRPGGHRRNCPDLMHMNNEYVMMWRSVTLDTMQGAACAPAETAHAGRRGCAKEPLEVARRPGR